jgi:hypothetical protein
MYFGAYSDAVLEEKIMNKKKVWGDRSETWQATSASQLSDEVVV